MSSMALLQCNERLLLLVSHADNFTFASDHHNIKEHVSGETFRSAVASVDGFLASSTMATICVVYEKQSLCLVIYHYDITDYRLVKGWAKGLTPELINVNSVICYAQSFWISGTTHCPLRHSNSSSKLT